MIVSSIIMKLTVSSCFWPRLLRERRWSSASSSQERTCKHIHDDDHDDDDDNDGDDDDDGK